MVLNVVLLVAAVIFESGLDVEKNRLMTGALVVVDGVTPDSVVVVVVVVVFDDFLHKTF